MFYSSSGLFFTQLKIIMNVCYVLPLHRKASSPLEVAIVAMWNTIPEIKKHKVLSIFK